MITVRELTPDDWAEWRALRLDALAQAPEAFGSTLAEWQGAGDTEARWRARLTSVAFNIVASLDGVPAGIASGHREDDAHELISMWVAPFARGRGVVDALIEAVAGSARADGAGELVLMVREANTRARAAYRRNGFVARGAAAPDERGDLEVLMVLDLASRQTGA